MAVTALLTWTLIPLATICFAIVVMFRARRSAPRNGDLTRAERTVVSVIATGAILLGGFAVLGLVVSAIDVFGSDERRVTDMPVTRGELPDFVSGVPGVVAGSYESAWIEVIGLPSSTRWLLYLEGALPAIATLAIVVAVGWIAMALLAGRPFTPALANAISVAAIGVMIGGLGSQIAGAFARASVVDFLGSREVTGGADSAGPRDGFAFLSLNLDLASVGWAFALLLIAAAFQTGARLQRDTEGLV
ncbi:hypothetical protein QSU92_07895 [Microbacterium sp. ET2]|uniref:hypothetical protein n=1 Tax=Microbacterium albipurpureum TaxID=3050384 RepID=UPI00259C6A22|nr:hypothetical protein [Microbacterium sp. ET2 (Ac-2212)]WJL97074.1 hypothetical protein QSU92_07895 [Microbacterium sp. ET2 (Ac-2212)]